MILGEEIPVGRDGVIGNPTRPGIAVFDDEGLGAAHGLLAAVAHPRVRVLGHPDARAVGAWGRVLADWLPVLDACATSGVAVELSGQVRRLPLPEGWHAAAQERGLELLLGADAYEPDDLDAALTALGQARGGGWAPGQVLNTLDATAFHAWAGE